jgi:Type ISP C-terminal specificity domain/N-6 DNA Methylase
VRALLDADRPSIGGPKALAARLAGLARRARDALLLALERDAEGSTLRAELQAFRAILLHDLTHVELADMVAQTLCYGLFAARCNGGAAEQFTRARAADQAPRTSPFLRTIFARLARPDLDARLAGIIDEIMDLLRRIEIAEILGEIGDRPGAGDPIVHFYEAFLAVYDPRMREARGVYSTPEPVVSYIVRSVDHLLQSHFDLARGLADRRVLILDPSTGTGTFLHGVIAHIHQNYRGDPGAWSSYVAEHLLPRLYGFELLMAPYAVAHMKLGAQLARSGYDFEADERLRVYLTNTLEADGASGEAPRLDREGRLLVVLGNPPYAGHSENRGGWIKGLLDDYKDGCPELKKPAQAKWLSDDYVKFFRLAQRRIEEAGEGILAFVSNHGYLDNPTFRGMRRSLMATFDAIYVLDLHGNTKKKELGPGGARDENVFDIQQGVAVGFFVKRRRIEGRPAEVRHAHLWGPRGESGGEPGKYRWLRENDLGGTAWTRLEPRAPAHLFVPQDRRLLPEYEEGWSIPDIFRPSGDPAPGIVTTHDDFAISWSAKEAGEKVERLLATASEGEARGLFRLCTQDQWRYDRAKRELAGGAWKNEITRLLYRPFDHRFTVWNRNVAVHRRERVMQHMLAGENLGLGTTRAIEIGRGWEHALCSRSVIQHHSVSSKEVNYLFPLYLYAQGPERAGPGRANPRQANLASAFTASIAARLRLGFVPDGRGDLRTTFGPEDVFDYIYAILHSRAYRARYAQYLKGDFARVPVTSDARLFRALSWLGGELVAAHLLEARPPLATRYPVRGDNLVEAVRYEEPEGRRGGRVWINATQRFDGVRPEVWSFRLGGYQVCRQWLKDRKGRALGGDDLTHFQRVVAALERTIQWMDAVDREIDRHRGWPVR